MDSWMQALFASSIFTQASWLVLLATVCTAVYFVARVWIVGFLRRLIARSETRWDDALVDSEVFRRLAHLAPAIVAFYGSQAIPDFDPTLQLIVQRSAVAIMIVTAALSSGAFLLAVNQIYGRSAENRHRPIKGYLQVIKILLYVVAGVSVLATLLDKSPLVFVSGVGAMSAVLLLIFKDTILSLVASVQITNNDLVHVGDWIEMPLFGADGDVIDVALHTVKIQNWDKTITTVPTHALISGSFKNWRGMGLSGGRRIKRSLAIDVNSVRFLRPEEEDRLARWSLLADYIAGKRKEIADYNAQSGRDPEISADIRRLTNVGTLRAYIFAYLRAHPKIHDEMTLLVRQLQPGPHGLPIEIYCFTNDTDWGVYEGIQSDLFDHILAIVPELGLRVYQSPSGGDIEQLAGQARDFSPGTGAT